MSRLSFTVRGDRIARPSGTWLTPSRATRWAAVRPTVRPSIRTDPLAARTRPEMVRNRVVLPAPFGPTTATASPEPTSRLTPCSASTAPYLATRDSTSSI